MSNTNFYKRFLIYFIVFGLIISSVGGVIHIFSASTIEEKNLKEKADEIYDIKINNILKPTLENIEKALQSLSKADPFIKYLKNKTETNKHTLQSIFLATVNANNNITQARYILSSGKEEIRVNRDTISQDSYLVDETKLQDKKNRYYFKEVSKLKQNMLWYSSIDLNKENGKIEIPYNPTLRIATPIFLEGTFHGILIFNLKVEKLFEGLANSTVFENFIIDEKQNFVLHPNKQFTFSKDKNIEHTLFDEFPNGLEDETIFKFSIQELFHNNKEITLVLKPKKNYIEQHLTTYIQVGIFSVFINFIISFIAAFIVARHPTKIQTQLLETNNKLNENKLFLESILNYSPLTIIAADKNGLMTLFNKKGEELLGYAKEELIGKQKTNIFHKESEIIAKAKEYSQELGIDIYPVDKIFTIKSELGLKNHENWTYVSKDGKEYDVSLHMNALKDLDGNIKGFMGIAEDITQIKEKEKELHNYIELVDKHIITSTTDIEGKITNASEAFCKISGYTKEELLGENHNIIRHPDMPKTTYKQLWNTILENKTWKGELKNKTKDGSYYWVNTTISAIFNRKGEKIGYTSIRQDITDKKIIEEISITDGLTGVYNRRHFDTLFPKIIKRTKRKNTLVSLLLLDVDHFKHYNDTYGHQMGDEVLTKIAQAIQNSLKRADDYCFRLGGEEFGVAFKADSKEKAYEFADTIRQNIENLHIEHKHNSASDYVTASMGLISKIATEIQDEDEIYNQVDKLLYKAKENGRNRVEM